MNWVRILACIVIGFLPAAISAETYSQFNEKVVFGFRSGDISYQSSSELSDYRIHKPHSGFFLRNRRLTYNCEMMPFDKETFRLEDRYGCSHVSILLDTVRLGRWRMHILPDFQKTGDDIAFSFVDDMAEIHDRLSQNHVDKIDLFHFPEKCLFGRSLSVDENLVEKALIVIDQGTSKTVKSACLLQGLKFSIGFYQTQDEVDISVSEFDLRDFLAIYLTYFTPDAPSWAPEKITEADYGKFLEIVRLGINIP